MNALISNNFANLMGSSIVCATIYLALAGVWKYHSMKAVFPVVAKWYEGSNPCEKQTFEFDVGFGRILWWYLIATYLNPLNFPN